MKPKQLFSLLICNFIAFTVGNGLMPLLPLYMKQLGGNEAIMGYYVSFAFLSLAAGAMAAGWFSDRFQCRKLLLIVAGLSMAPFTLLMGWIRHAWQLFALTGITWFLAGGVVATITILIGLFAAETRRGRIFGMLGVSMGLGTLAGGLFFGRFVDWRGYPFLFVCIAVFYLVVPIMGFLLEDKVVQRRSAAESKTVNKQFPKAFILLLAAHLLALTVVAAVNFGRSVSMDRMGFSSSAITSTMAAAGIVGILAPLLLGWLSDRLGRKPFLIFCYLSFGLAALITAWANLYMHFFAALALLALGAVSQNVGAALVSDLVPPQRLGTGMSLFQNMYWLGMMIGFAVSGNLLMRMSMRTTFLAWTAFPIAAVVLVSLIRRRAPVTVEDSGANQS
jgi:MFS family permease